MQSRKVFIESDIFYSFINRADERYPQASAFFRYFAEQKFQVFTSYPVQDEVYRQIYERISPSLAKDFLRGMSLSSVNILYPTESDAKAALKSLINYQSSELTFREAQTAVLSNRNYINQVCTFRYVHPLFGIGAFSLPI
jgi:predicted nucleic acid-binding protein